LPHGGPARVEAWTHEHIDAGEREQFKEMAENELLGLHEGNFARYKISPVKFKAWREAWASLSAKSRR